MSRRCNRTFPDVQQLMEDETFTAFRPLLPARLLLVPKVPRARGHRVRQRAQQNRDTVLIANDLLRSLNSLNAGLRSDKVRTTCQSRISFEESLQREDALTSLHSLVMKHAATVALARRELGPGRSQGAHLAQELIKMDLVDRYHFQPRNNLMVPMVAANIAEPPIGAPVVEMLEALPLREREFYSDEDNVIDPVGKCDAVFQELQERHAFIGGSYSEYVAYMNRTDMPPDIWHFSTADDVKAVAGVTCVHKKCGVLQRKIIMQVASNYWFSSVDERTNLGMTGGSAVSGLFDTTGSARMATWDQGNAFTSVRTPRWMWPWVTAPPLRARDIWKRLSSSLRSLLGPAGWVYPQYTRLAMGSSHAVFILMSINLHCVGKTLWNYCRLGAFEVDVEAPATTSQSSELCKGESDDDEATTLPGSDDEAPDISECESIFEGARSGLLRSLWEDGEAPATVESEEDELWHQAQSAKRAQSHQWQSATVETRTMAEFMEAARAARRQDRRCFVVLHLFSGPRRHGDVEHHLRREMQDKGLQVVVVSVDLDADARWDLSDPLCFHELLQMIHQGLIDGLIGGPPCATWSRLRFLPGGPRPVRTRSHPWGLSGLTRAERSRVREANALMIHFLALAEALALRGGVFLLEHPADPGQEPFPSVFATPQLTEMADRVGAVLGYLEQCALGGPAKKPTGLLSTIEAFWGTGPTCPGLSGQHRHATGGPKVVNGAFASQRLSAYASPMCAWFAAGFADVFERWFVSGDGPTGFRRGEEPIRAITQWSSLRKHKDAKALVMLNEKAALSERSVLDHNSVGFYLHVDDGLLIGPGASEVNEAMEGSAQSLRDLGFIVNDLNFSDALDRVVGYQVLRSPPGLCFPIQKGIKLQEAMLWLCSLQFVCVDAVHSLLGIWVYGALLRRDLLSAAAAVFQFVDKIQGKTTAWWPSARREFRTMAHLIPFMRVNLSLPAAPVVFASDAQGAGELGEHDAGGFGIVAADIDSELFQEIWKTSVTPGRTVVKLDGSLGSKWSTRSSLSPTIPFSRLPRRLFDRHWPVLSAGRWHIKDHITLGEARAHCRIVQALVSRADTHGHRIATLQDNMPTSASMSKGRACAPALNFLCRRRCAHNLAADLLVLCPWLESALQPADDASRQKHASDDRSSVPRLHHRGEAQRWFH